MNKQLILLGGVGALGIMLFCWKKKSSSLKTPMGIPAPANSPGAKPRVDNQQQPWYTGALNFVDQKAGQYKQNPALAQSDLQSVVHSASDVWGTVSGFFGSGQSTAQSVDDVPEMNSTDASVASDQDIYSSLPASSADQSNTIGDQMGSDFNSLNYGFTSPSDSTAMVDWSDSDGFGSDNVA